MSVEFLVFQNVNTLSTDSLVLSFQFTNVMSNACVVVDLGFKNFIVLKTNENDFCLHLYVTRYCNIEIGISWKIGGKNLALT